MILVNGVEKIDKIEKGQIHSIYCRVNKKYLIQINSTSRYGNLSFRYGEKEEVMHYRNKFLTDIKILLGNYIRNKKFTLPILLKPQHRNNIEVVNIKIQGSGWKSYESAIETDALLLYPYPERFILPLGVLVADCAPVCFYSPSVKAFLLGHISRKNIDIVKDAILLMLGLYYAANDKGKFELNIIVGPCGRYNWREGASDKIIDIQQLIVEKIQEFEEEKKLSKDTIKISLSQYYTTNEKGLFFSHHLISNGDKNEKRFMSLSMII